MRSTLESLESLSQRQQEMEDHALALGGQRFRKKLEEAIQSGTEAQVGAAKKLLAGGLNLVEKAMADLIAPKKGVGGSRRASAEKWVRALGPEVAAYLALKVILDNIHGRVSVRRAAFDVTELVIDELRFRRFKKEAPRLFEYAMTSFTTSSYAHKARSLDARIHKEEVDISDLQMGQNERFTVGVKLLDIVIQTTQLVTVEKQSFREGGKNTTLVELVATPETIEWLTQGNDKLEFLWPVNLPMVMPPLAWAPGRKGGYRYGLRGKHRLVRSHSKAHRELVEKTEMPQVYAALNRIQETPWRINGAVLEVLQAIINAGGSSAGVPPMSEEPLPPKPHDIDTNEAAKKVWRKAAHRVHEENHASRIRRAELFRLLSIVNKVRDEDAVWFPHNLDFRGRVYPVTNYLHPQGDDLCKGLLQFAEGKALGRDGVAYLLLHGASSLGKTPAGAKLSHMTLTERIEFMVSIGEDLCAIAEDPLGETWWMDADDKWQFLAFCFDFKGFWNYHQEGRGEAYVSSLPVAMDGTCNGLQHFAALWLDPVGGAAVNVVPSEKPQDIYQTIANVVLGRLEVASQEPMAALWLTSGIVDRKLTKRPTMTFGYGSQTFGFTEQLKEYVQSHDDWKGKLKGHFQEDMVNAETGEVELRSNLQPACAYMAKLIWEALETIAVSAFGGMAWMRAAAKVISKDAKKCVSWVVPGTHFPVRQAYVDQKAVQVKTILGGSIFKPTAYEDTHMPSWKKQTSSVAPNIVHSLDAAALMLTVNQAADSGIQHFAMVHDSYGTLAGDAPVLAAVTRQAFHGLYTQNDVVTSLWGQFQDQAEGLGEDKEIPVPPMKGYLREDGSRDVMDLGGVLLSDYFFS